jgi:glycosyltransferase involved in cell wall biosynthesis
MKVLIIVPAFNEEDNIQNTILDLKTNTPNYDILVINDGSKDQTSKLAKNSGAKVIDMPINVGIGGAVQTGFIYASKNDYDIAIQFDGDGQHKAQEILPLIAPILSKESDVVIGSRFLEKDNEFRSTFTRRIGIKFFELLNSVLIGQRITDNTSGFRAYNKTAIKLLANNYPEDFPEPEAVILLGKNGFKIKEIFSHMRERKGGVSSISATKSVYFMIKVTLSILITAIKPKLVKSV